MSSPPPFRFDDPSDGAPKKQPKSDQCALCAMQSNQFENCHKFRGKDNSHCQFLKDKLTECRKDLNKPLPLIPLPSLEDSEAEDDMYVLTGDPCFAQSQTFEDCVKTSGDDSSSQCDFLKDKLTECRKAASSNSNYVSRSYGIDDDEYWH